MSKRKKPLKFYADADADMNGGDDLYQSAKGKKPRSRDRKKGAKRAYYDD